MAKTTTKKTTAATKSKPAAKAAPAKASKPAPAKAAAAKKTPSKAPAKAVKPAKAKASGENLGDDAIAKRAYEIWVEQGCPEGRDLENWTRAEQEINGK